MKAKSLFLFLVIPLILALASCFNGTISGYNVPGSKLAEKLEWLKDNAESGCNYALEIGSDENIPSNQRLEYSGKTNIIITLKGLEGNRTINLSSNGNMFVVGTGVTLVLENITLRGRSFNTYSLILVRTGGELRMKDGALITGNTAQDGFGGGVRVEGILTMNSGTISGNASKNDGGGVYVSAGTFIMKGGTISGNTANNGGGIAVSSKGTFVMSEGTISGNTASYGGGVAALYGNFTMGGGTISGNISERDGGGVYAANARNAAGTQLGIGNIIMNGGTISGNTARNGGGVGISNEGTFVMNDGYITSNAGARGGGVLVAINTSFTMSGGTISGNTASSNGGGMFVEGVFAKTGGTITGFESDRMNGNVVSSSLGFVESESGHTVYAYYSGSKVTKRKETTAGSRVNLSYTGRTGSFSGGWDY